MTTTTNYQLPQWEATDAIRRGDFNAAMSAIDAGMAGAMSAADDAKNAAQAAQATADEAVETLAGRFVYGNTSLAGDAAVGTVLATGEGTIKAAILWTVGCTPAALYPEMLGWMYFGDWAIYRVFRLVDNKIILYSGNTDTSGRSIHYILFY